MKEYNFCLRCGKKLKNPIARQKGYGIVCEKKMQTEKAKQLFKPDNKLQS